MGFGHRVYKVKDPRATILQGLCERLFKECGSSPLYEVAVEVERVAAELLKGKGIYPNVDFYSGIVYDKMGIETDLFTPLFAMARVSGWLAHWLEQLRENKLFRLITLPVSITDRTRLSTNAKVSPASLPNVAHPLDSAAARVICYSIQRNRRAPRRDSEQQ
jgi:citrate synthase